MGEHLPHRDLGREAADFQLRSACKRLGLSGMLGLDDMHIVCLLLVPQS